MDEPPSLQDALLLVVGEVSLVVLHIGDAEVLGPPLTHGRTLELPVMRRRTLERKKNGYQKPQNHFNFSWVIIGNRTRKPADLIIIK